MLSVVKDPEDVYSHVEDDADTADKIGCYVWLDESPEAGSMDPLVEPTHNHNLLTR